MKRELVKRLMYENAEKNADSMGFTQHIKLSKARCMVRNIYGTYDIDGESQSEKVIDYSTKTMLSCGTLTADELERLGELLSIFPEGSQAVFCHSLGEAVCQRILSAYGIRIYEHINLDAVAKQFGAEPEDKERLYYCLAVKARSRGYN